MCTIQTKTMKKKKLILFLFSLCLLISCNPEVENFTEIERNLINGVWKLESTERLTYKNDNYAELAWPSVLTINESDSKKLMFTEDYRVSYESPFIIEKLYGNWEISEDEIFLFTDLNISPSSSTGSNTIYYYPQSKIVEIDKNRMILESMPENSFYSGSGTTTEKYTSFVRSIFKKK